MLRVLELYPEQSSNIYTDSRYVFTVFHSVEMAITSHATAEGVFHLFYKAQVALMQRIHQV